MKIWPLGYKKAKEKARNLYVKIGRIQCPALNNECIAFTNEGFNHILRKGRIPRTKNEQKRRLSLIPYIERILKNPRAVVCHEHRNTRTIINRYGNKLLIKSTADFWTFTERIDGCVIKVVVRQIPPNGQKHFMSVMGDVIKINNINKKSRY